MRSGRRGSRGHQRRETQSRGYSHIYIHMDDLRVSGWSAEREQDRWYRRIPWPITKLIFMHRPRTWLAWSTLYTLSEHYHLNGWLPGWLSKPGKHLRLTSSYRPINILSAFSKVWKNTFMSAIEMELELDPFHRNQLGFRRRNSTIDGISQVSKFADTCRKNGLIWIMMCIDDKNAFSTLWWEVILKEARRRSPSYKLTRVLANYLKDRFVEINCSGPRTIRAPYFRWDNRGSWVGITQRLTGCNIYVGVALGLGVGMPDASSLELAIGAV